MQTRFLLGRQEETAREPLPRKCSVRNQSIAHCLMELDTFCQNATAAGGVVWCGVDMNEKKQNRYVTQVVFPKPTSTQRNYQGCTCDP
ncbi:hypothetical protein BaRGS_00025670 [Batillaria attramentaria]|uniref:Uncharacterized protein n=1 Tax=Batillaria attramentaria TaxID=370345 RepID=A0ABD0K7E8_9CAEN